MNTVLIFITLILFICAPGSLRALEFRVLSWEGSIKNVKYDEGSKTTEITAFDGGFSPVYFLKNATKLELYRDTDTVGVRESLVVVAAPEPSVTRAILILVPVSGGSYLARWVDDSPEIHPANTLRIHNFTRLPLAFQSGNEQWRQAPGDVHNLGIAHGLRQMPLRIAGQIDGQWGVLWGSMLPVRKNYRVHLFVRDIAPPGEALGASVYPLLIYDYVPPVLSGAGLNGTAARTSG